MTGSRLLPGSRKDHQLLSRCIGIPDYQHKLTRWDIVRAKHPKEHLGAVGKKTEVAGLSLAWTDFAARGCIFDRYLHIHDTTYRPPALRDHAGGRKEANKTPWIEAYMTINMTNPLPAPVV